MSIKTYRLLCEACGWRKVTTGADTQDLVEVETSKVQTTLDKINQDGTIEPAKFCNQPKKFRCPGCGRPIRPKRISGGESEVVKDDAHPFKLLEGEL